MKDDDSGGSYACVGVVGIWDISVPAAVFSYELKPTLKKIEFIKKNKLVDMSRGQTI